ncbi:MAG: hypothetical protein EXR79_10880 [Myxococcales bacterium]|nr:hypothetical protein [Myxococcales bacterium]
MTAAPAADFALPPVARFVWLGRALPDLAWLALRRALDRAQLDAIWLHTDTAALAEDPAVRDLVARGVRLDVWAPTELLATGLGSATDASLARLWARLERPAARADLARLALLWRHGGIYLDTDLIVVRSLRVLCAPGRPPGFAGLEQVCLPAAVVHSLNPLRWARAAALLAVRDWLSRSPAGPRRYARVAHHYDLACNNAVLASRAGHDLIGELLDRAARLPLARALQLYELGPRLLEAATSNVGRADFDLLEPAAFYPLPPEICAAYVRDDPREPLDADLNDATHGAHLYDSVLARRLGRAPDLAWLRAHRDGTWLGRVAAPYLDALIGLRAR